MPVNCGAIPADLLESELFGHEKGAFTGALSTRVGRFEFAEGGTLFLDEIGDMSLQMQVKLLRVLQERTFERVGSNRTIALQRAHHRGDSPGSRRGDLAGRFREDLFYRLNVFPVQMPPLRERLDDLPILIEHLLCRQGQNCRTPHPARQERHAAAWHAIAGPATCASSRTCSSGSRFSIRIRPSAAADLPERYRAGGNCAFLGGASCRRRSSATRCPPSRSISTARAADEEEG